MMKPTRVYCTVDAAPKTREKARTSSIGREKPAPVRTGGAEPADGNEPRRGRSAETQALSSGRGTAGTAAVEAAMLGAGSAGGHYLLAQSRASAIDADRGVVGGDALLGSKLLHRQPVD